MAQNTQSDQVTVIGIDTHITGQMHFSNTARILGKFDGSITSDGEVQIGDTATCKATIEAQRVVIDGAVEGDITAHEKLALNASADISGDLNARTLSVAEGATFVGYCRVGADTTSGGKAASKTSQMEAKSSSPTPAAATASKAASDDDASDEAKGESRNGSAKRDAEALLTARSS